MASTIGRVGGNCFKVVASFVRPTNTTQYTANDAITNSDSSATVAVLSFDMKAFGSKQSEFICITNARVISNVKPTALSLNANIWIMPQTWSSALDNAEFSVDDVTAATGGVVIPCLNAYTTALNHRCVSDPTQIVMQLPASSTSVFFSLQSANAYTPQSLEQFSVVFEGYLL